MGILPMFFSTMGILPMFFSTMGILPMFFLLHPRDSSDDAYIPLQVR